MYHFSSKNCIKNSFSAHFILWVLSTVSLHRAIPGLRLWPKFENFSLLIDHSSYNKQAINHFVVDVRSTLGGQSTATPQKINLSLHTTLYGSAAGCRSIQKMCAFWKHGLISKITYSQLTYFCKSNINQTFTNGGGMIWGVRIAIFTEIRHLVEELITFLSFFGPQKLSILTARLIEVSQYQLLIQ